MSAVLTRAPPVSLTRLSANPPRPDPSTTAQRGGVGKKSLRNSAALAIRSCSVMRFFRGSKADLPARSLQFGSLLAIVARHHHSAWTHAAWQSHHLLKSDHLPCDEKRWRPWDRWYLLCD